MCKNNRFSFSGSQDQVIDHFLCLKIDSDTITNLLMRMEDSTTSVVKLAITR